jgi:hypothetical protein
MFIVFGIKDDQIKEKIDYVLSPCFDEMRLTL